MDGCFKLVVLLCLPGIFSVQGYIFRVKSDTTGKGVCLTDEQYSAIAPIQPLDSELKTSSENGWLASVNESIDEFECNPNVHCKNWNLNNSRVEPYITFNFFSNDFVRTRSWNYFQEYKTDGNDEFITPVMCFNEQRHWLRMSTLLRLSILAEEFEILLTDGPNWQGRPGILISFQTGDLPTVCLFHNINNSSGFNCTQLRANSDAVQHDPKLGRKWVHLKLFMKEWRSLKLYINIDGAYYSSSNMDISSFLDLPTGNEDLMSYFRYATFRSKNKPGLFKLFTDYALLRIQKQPLIFQAHSINLLRPRKIAFNFIRRAYYNYSVEVDGTALNGTFPSNSSIEKNELYTDYIEIAKTHSAESNVTISLTSNDRAYLLSIGLASEGHNAFYIDGDLSACQIIETGEVTSNARNDTVPESLPDISFEEVCDKLHAPNCRGVEACSPDGCFCFSGHTRSAVDGKCTEECDENHYGPNCIHEISYGKCVLRKNLHTGCPKCEYQLGPADYSQNVFKLFESSGFLYIIIPLLCTTVLCLLQSLIIVYILN